MMALSVLECLVQQILNAPKPAEPELDKRQRVRATIEARRRDAVLSLLGERGMTAREVAEGVCISYDAAYAVLYALERDELVRRVSERRLTPFSLTATGQTAMQAARERIAKR